MKIELIFLLQFILFYSCSSNKNENLIDIFPDQDTLVLTKLENISSDVLGKPRDIFIIGNYFIIRDEIDNNWYTLLNKETGKLIRHFGQKGRGPHEFLYPIDQEPYLDKFYIYDSSQDRLHLCSIDSLAANSNNYILKSIKIRFKTKQHAECRQLVMLSSGEILAICCHPDGRFVLFDTTGLEKQAFYPDYPVDELHKDENYIAKSFAFQYTCMVNNDNSRIYNISTTTGHVEIFEIKNNNMLRLVNNLYHLPKYKNTCTETDFSVLFSPESKPGFFNPEITNKYLYAAYENQAPPHHTYIAHDVLFKFDLDGNPLQCYNLSSRISRFYIEEETGVLYAIGSDPTTLEPCIFTAKIE